MKNLMKVCLLGMLLVAFCGLAPAASIQCTPTNQNVIQNSTSLAGVSVSCSQVNAAVNTHFTDWRIDFLASWQDSINQTTLHSVTFSAQVVGFTPAQDAVCTTPSTTVIGFCQATGASAIIANATTTSLGPFTVNIAGLAAGGTVLPDNASVTVNLVTNTAPNVAGIPEPMTMSLMGAGLLVLGFAGRKFRKI